MRSPRAIIICVILTVCMSIPSLFALPMMLSFTDPEVRQKAPLAVQELRMQGLWGVNTTLESVERDGEDVCFVFYHRYRSRGTVDAPEHLSICL